VGKATKYNFALCAAVDAGKIHFKFEIFYSGSEVSAAHSKVTMAPIIFRHSAVAP
jgi:hypothetical protein